MERIKNLNYKKIIISIIIIGIIILLAIIVIYKTTFLNRYIIPKRNEWDISTLQNSSTNGNMMGFMYEKDYDINSIPTEYLSSIIINYYITNDNSFFDDKNIDENGIYQKKVTNQKIDDITKKLFGPQSQIHLQNVKYGCNIQATSYNDYYIISAGNPDDCGAFSENDDSYISYISNYYFDKEKNIIIEEKVGFIDTIYAENKEFKYVLYSNKLKKQILDNNYDTNCLFNEKVNSICYQNLITYKIMLKKASNNKYYFYKIWKEK